MTFMHVFLDIVGIPKHIHFLNDDLTIEECFCAPIYGRLILSSNLAIKDEAILNRRISIEVKSAQGHGRHFHGYVTEYVLKGVQATCRGCCYVYKFKFASFIHHLKGKKYFRVFSDKTISEMIYCLLKPYLTGVNYEIRIQDKKRKNYIQYDVTDFDFLSQLLKANQLFYFFRTTEPIETIVITNTYDHWSESILLTDVSIGEGRALDWQMQYYYGEPDNACVTSHYFRLSASSIFQTQKKVVETWVVKQITHRFRHLYCSSYKEKSISAHYENQFCAVEKNYFDVCQLINSANPDFAGIEKSKIVGHKNNRLRVICLRTENKNPIVAQRAEIRQGENLTTHFLPQKNQTVLIGFLAESITDVMVLGGLFKTYQLWPLDMDQEGISISSEKIQQKLVFNTSGVNIKSSGDFTQFASRNLVFNINGEENINIGQSLKYQCAKGNFYINAQSIILQVGSSCIELTKNGICIKSEKIFLN